MLILEYTKKPSIFQVNLLYLILGFLLIFLGSYVQGREVYSGLLITEYLIILLPNLSYLKFKGCSLKKILKLNKISMKQLLIIILIVIFTYPVAVFLNLIVITILSSFGDIIPNSVPIPKNSLQYLLGLFVIAISPGICEEIMFRGTIMNAYDKLGKKKSIIYSAILFGLFHFNLQNLLGPIFLGIIFGIIVYKTDSIYSSVIAHLLNNTIALTIGYATTKAQNNVSNTNVETLGMSTQVQLLIALVFIGGIALVSGIILKILLKILPETENSIDYDEDILYETYTKGKNNLFEYLPIIIIIIVFIVRNVKYLFV